MGIKTKSEIYPNAAEQISVAMEHRALVEQDYWRARMETLRGKCGQRQMAANILTLGVERLADELLAIAFQSPPTWMDLRKLATGGEIDLHLSQAAQTTQHICRSNPDSAFAAYCAVQVIEQRDRIKAHSLFWERLGCHPEDPGLHPVISSIAGIAWRASLESGASAELARRARERGEYGLISRYEGAVAEMASLVRIALEAILEADASYSDEDEAERGGK